MPAVGGLGTQEGPPAGVCSTWCRPEGGEGEVHRVVTRLRCQALTTSEQPEPVEQRDRDHGLILGCRKAPYHRVTGFGAVRVYCVSVPLLVERVAEYPVPDWAADGIGDRCGGRCGDCRMSVAPW